MSKSTIDPIFIWNSETVDNNSDATDKDMIIAKLNREIKFKDEHNKLLIDLIELYQYITIYDNGIFHKIDKKVTKRQKEYETHYVKLSKIKQEIADLRELYNS